MRCRFCHNPDTWRTEGGTLMGVDELLDRAERYRSYWGPEGGITVSGGEALAQAEFVAELFEAAHARGINTCLDTSLAPFTRDFIASLGDAVKRVEVLPYHTLGVFKWEELGIPYTLSDVEPPSHEDVVHAEQILRGSTR